MSVFSNEAPVLSSASSMTVPVEFTLVGTAPATAGNYSTFFIADRNYVFVKASEIHHVASTGGATTLDVTNDTGTQAPGAGSSVLGGSTFNLAAAADTLQSIGAEGNFPPGVLIPVGSRLSAKLTGTPTSMTNLQLEVTLRGI